MAPPLAAVGVRAALEPALGSGNALTLLYPVVLVVAAIAGLGPALASIVVATLASAFVLTYPAWSLALSAGDVLGLLLFFVVCVAIALLTVRFKDARVAAEESVARAEQSAARAEESAARAERLLRLREGFAAMLAHEIRTPVTVILGNAKLLPRRSRHDGTRLCQLVQPGRCEDLAVVVVQPQVRDIRLKQVRGRHPARRGQ